MTSPTDLCLCTHERGEHLERRGVPGCACPAFRLYPSLLSAPSERYCERCGMADDDEGWRFTPRINRHDGADGLVCGPVAVRPVDWENRVIAAAAEAELPAAAAYAAIRERGQ